MLFAVACLASTTSGAVDRPSSSIHITPSVVNAALGLGGFAPSTSPWFKRREAAARAVVDWGTEILSAPAAQAELQNADPPTDPRYAFFRFVPSYVTSVKSGATSAPWKSNCFLSTRVTFNGTALTFIYSEPVGATLTSTCSDNYVIATVDGLALVQLSSFEARPLLPNLMTVAWNATTAVEKKEKVAIEWDLETKGVRVFSLLTGPMQVISDVVETAKLFLSEAVKKVPNATAQLNMQFLSSYTPFKMEARVRSGPEVHFDADDVRSGDFFGIVRLDGLDPMLAWAMGSTTGHTTVALWKRGSTAAADALYVCESTATSGRFNAWISTQETLSSCAPVNSWNHSPRLLPPLPFSRSLPFSSQHSVLGNQWYPMHRVRKVACPRRRSGLQYRPPSAE